MIFDFKILFQTQGTQLIVSNYFIHNDERIWNNPEDFSPDRFIIAEGKYQAPKEGFFAFGAGNLFSDDTSKLKLLCVSLLNVTVLLGR